MRAGTAAAGNFPIRLHGLLEEHCSCISGLSCKISDIYVIYQEYKSWMGGHESRQAGIKQTPLLTFAVIEQGQKQAHKQGRWQSKISASEGGRALMSNHSQALLSGLEGMVEN